MAMPTATRVACSREARAVCDAGVAQRAVVIELDTVDQGAAAQDSPACREALAALGNGAERDIRLVSADVDSAHTRSPVGTLRSRSPEARRIMAQIHHRMKSCNGALTRR